MVLKTYMHVFFWIVFTFVAFSILYAFYMLFFVCKPPDGYIGPIFHHECDKELLAIRRLYAIEFWILFLGLVFLSFYYYSLNEQIRLE